MPVFIISKNDILIRSSRQIDDGRSHHVVDKIPRSSQTTGSIDTEPSRSIIKPIGVARQLGNHFSVINERPARCFVQRGAGFIEQRPDLAKVTHGSAGYDRIPGNILIWFESFSGTYLDETTSLVKKYSNVVNLGGSVGAETILTISPTDHTIGSHVEPHVEHISILVKFRFNSES